ncbi:MAG: hypothetical protein OEX01_05050 [Candidatus Bathyarchaeota archaeon]|nr:hypothetical protein [Candidatus Bathyarchaeota archaeon]
MEKDAATAIIEEYEKQCKLFTTFTEKAEKLIRDLLKENHLCVHSVTSRVKDKAKLHSNLTQSGKEFSKLSDVPDISGLRIITYFADEVDSIAEMVEKEFNVDRKRSVDKRELLDPDRFGYLSLHYIVKLSASRLKLTEYRRFANCHAEIQIRSILQHAWAEIEHDLGYKSKYAVPRDVRRRFSRLAGLLEIADDEFIQIRDGLLEYERNVPKEIVEAPASVLIDKASLLSFIRTNSLVQELDRKIASIAKSKIREHKGRFMDGLVDELRYARLRTIAELDSKLCEEREKITKFAELWITPSKYDELGAGISLFYLIYVLIGKEKSIEKARDYITTSEIGPPDEIESNAEKIISIYSKIAGS